VLRNDHSADDWEGVLKPDVVRYKRRKVGLYFRDDAAFASPEMYEYLEAEGFLYAMDICSRDRLAGRRFMCGALAPASAIRLEAGRGSGAWWPSASGILASCAPASASIRFAAQALPTCPGQPSGWWPTSINEVRLQLHALAYNLANSMPTLAVPKEVEHWSPTTLPEKLVNIAAKVVRHGRYVTFQLAEVAVPRDLFRKIIRLIDGPRPAPLPP
jgi:hypothetical protein